MFVIYGFVVFALPWKVDSESNISYGNIDTTVASAVS